MKTDFKNLLNFIIKVYNKAAKRRNQNVLEIYRTVVFGAIPEPNKSPILREAIFISQMVRKAVPQ